MKGGASEVGQVNGGPRANGNSGLAIKQRVVANNPTAEGYVVLYLDPCSWTLLY